MIRQNLLVALFTLFIILLPVLKKAVATISRSRPASASFVVWNLSFLVSIHGEHAKFDDDSSEVGRGAESLPKYK